MLFEIQHAPDNGSGAPNAGAATTIATNLLGTQRSYHDPQPIDGATHWYRHRHVGYGDTAGAWSDWVSAKAIIQRPEGPTDSLATPLNSQSRLRVRLRNSANIAGGVGTNVITWDTEDYDIGSLHTGSSSLITIPVGGDLAPWHFVAQVEWDNNVTGYRELHIFKNGASIARVRQLPLATAGPNGLIQQVTLVDQPAVGDTFQVETFDNSGGARTITPDFFTAIMDW
jgi:hypothetical protein